MRVLATVWVCVAVLGCGDDAQQTDDATPPAVDAPRVDAPIADSAVSDALPLDCTPAAGTSLDLQLVAQNLVQPIAMLAPPGDTRLFIVERPGRIKILQDGAVLATPFIDLRPIVTFPNEMGLLGMAFHPSYASNGRFFLYYTVDVDPDEPERIADTVIAEYTVSADGNVANTTERRLLVIAQPAANHNGGHIAFGPDGYLYIGLGDGGAVRANGQLLTTPLGAMLRIDVDNGDPFAVPDDNPFVGIGGIDPTIWIYGLRNPWRWSFDRQTGDMYIGDVGAAEREEINVKLAGTSGGDNFGWPVFEGDQCLDGPCGDPSPYTAPVVTYDHGNNRCAVVGGYVYRGSCMPDVQGWYLYADHCSGEVWKLELANGAATEMADLTGDLNSATELNSVTAFGEDARGELYVARLNGNLYRLVAD